MLDIAECPLCPHRCRLTPGRRGICRARENRDGKIVPLTYGRVGSLALDPVEKKPLYHFHPGREILSIGGWGCNLRCAFCQNWEISQNEVPTRELSPAALIATARAENVTLIAHTYNEPYINYEYVLDCCRAAREAGMKNVLVTNGYANPEPAARLLAWVDAVNIDLKAFTDGFYRHHCGAELAPVLEIIKLAARACHTEITTLLIPGENDNTAEISAAAAWLAENCGADTPYHLSAYFPRYRFTAPPTPPETVLRAREAARKHLRFVYAGNLAPGRPGGDSDTLCPECGALAVRRTDYRTEICGLTPDGRCAQCGRGILRRI